MEYKKGSHLKVKYLTYTHHVIKVGRGRIIHYSEGIIKIERLDRYLSKENLSITNVEYVNENSSFSVKEIMRRAKSKLGENSYNLVFNNCEHFTTWVFHDKKESKQVKRVFGVATVAFPKV